MIYLKIEDDIKEFEDTPTIREAINIDKRIAWAKGLKAELYSDENLPDDLKLSLGKITQQELDEIKAEEDKQKRISEIYQRFSEIDQESIRALRAISAKKEKPADAVKVKDLDDEADLLRAELSALEVE